MSRWSVLGQEEAARLGRLSQIAPPGLQLRPPGALGVWSGRAVSAFSVFCIAIPRRTMEAERDDRCRGTRKPGPDRTSPAWRCVEGEQGSTAEAGRAARFRAVIG